MRLSEILLLLSIASADLVVSQGPLWVGRNTRTLSLTIFNSGPNVEQVSAWFNNSFQNPRYTQRTPRRSLANETSPITPPSNAVAYDANASVASWLPISGHYVLNLKGPVPYVNASASRASLTCSDSISLPNADTKKAPWTHKFRCGNPHSRATTPGCTYSLEQWDPDATAMILSVPGNTTCTDRDIMDIVAAVNQYSPVSTIEMLQPRELDGYVRQLHAFPFENQAGGLSFNPTWSSSDDIGSLASAYEMVEAPQAWTTLAQYPITESPTVMIIDTPTAQRHPELENNYLLNKVELRGSHGVDDDGDGVIDNVRFLDGTNMEHGDPSIGGHYHGTASMAIIGGRPNNRLNGAGLAPNVRLLHCNGGGTSISINAQGRCLQYAVNNAKRFKIRIINQSFSAQGAINAEREAIRAAGRAGLITTTSTGNSDIDFDAVPASQLRYPWAYRVEGDDFAHIIGVPRVDENSRPLPSGYSKKWMPFSMPGVYVTPSEDTVNLGSITVSGTSFSSPAGAAYLSALLTVNYKLELADLLWITENTIRRLPDSDHRCEMGGVPSFAQALDAAAGGWLKRSDFGPNMQDFLSIPPRSTYTLTFNVTSENASSGDIIVYRRDESRLNGALKIASVPVTVDIV